MKRKLILLTTVLSCIAASSYAQIDKHFSMFSDTKVQINPAAAGFFRAKYNIQANYRRQWAASSSPFTTYSANYEMRVYEENFGKKFIAGGLYFFNDVVGDSKYVQTQIVVPVSYAIRLNDFNFLSFGISPGFFQRNVRNTDFTWSSQWDGLDFDETIDSRESLVGSKYSISKFDVGAGLFWEIELNEINSMSVGVSGNHLTRPKVNIFQEDLRMNRTLNVHYFGTFGRDGMNVTLKPSAMYSLQGPNSYVVFGSSFDFLLRGSSIHTGFYDRSSIEFGAHMRLNDALIFSTQIHKGGFTAGFAYDMVISSLSSFTNLRGASEFFISLRIGKAKGGGKLELDEDGDE